MVEESAVNRREFLTGAGLLATAALGYGVRPDGRPPAEVRARSFWEKQGPGGLNPWWKLCLGWLPSDAHGSETYATLFRYRPWSFPDSWTIRFCHVDHTFEASTLTEAQRHAEQQVAEWLRAVLRELERQAFGGDKHE